MGWRCRPAASTERAFRTGCLRGGDPEPGPVRFRCLSSTSGWSGVFPAIVLGAFPVIVLGAFPAIVLGAFPAIVLGVFPVIVLGAFPPIVLGAFHPLRARPPTSLRYAPG